MKLPKNFKNILSISVLIFLSFFIGKNALAETAEEFYRRCAWQGIEAEIEKYPKTYYEVCCTAIPSKDLTQDQNTAIERLCKQAQPENYPNYKWGCDPELIKSAYNGFTISEEAKIFAYQIFEQCCAYCLENPDETYNIDGNLCSVGDCGALKNTISENLFEQGKGKYLIGEKKDISTLFINKCLGDCNIQIRALGGPISYYNTCCEPFSVIQKNLSTLTSEQRTNLNACCDPLETELETSGQDINITPSPVTSTQSTAQESQSKIVCRAMAKQDYKECGKSGEALWKCRIESWITQVFCQIMYALIDGIGAAISYIMNLEVNAILWAINPQTYGGFSTNPGVREVWTFMRDLVNLVLIIGMIIIAVATMLRIEKWGWKNTLWKLVVVALLVNFSLIIPGMVIDVSNFLSFYFLNAAKGENANLGLAILKSFGFAISNNQATAPAFLDQGVAQIAGGSETTEGVIDYAARQGYVAKFLLIAIALILIGFFAILTLFATFLVMILRAVLMCILLVVAPLTFASWIFPATASYFRKWWSFFIQWCLVPVIFSFLLYTSITILNVSQISQGGILASIIQLVLFSMFLVAGLVISIKQSGGITEKIISGLSSAITVAMGGLAGVIGGAFSSRVVAGQGTTGQAWKSMAERLEKSRFRPLHNTGLKMQTSTQNVAAEREKALSGRFDKMTAEQIERDILANRKNPFLAAAGFSKLIEKGKLDSTNEELMAVFQKIVNHPAFNKKELKDHRPDLYRQYVQTDQFNKDIQEIMQKQKVNADEASKIAIRNATQEALLKASPEDIKKMDIANILKNLQNIGQLNQTLNELILQRKMDPESLADVFRKMNAQERNEWLQTFKQAMIETKGFTSEQELQSEMGRLGYLRNRFLHSLFTVKEGETKEGKQAS